MRFPALPMIPTAFQVIDTPQKAYLLGFLLADGCVLAARPGYYRARVNLRILAGDIQACRMVQQVAGGKREKAKRMKASERRGAGRVEVRVDMAADLMGFMGVWLGDGYLSECADAA